MNFLQKTLFVFIFSILLLFSYKNFVFADVEKTRYINRSEFVKIALQKVFSDKEISGSNCFPDVKNEDFAKYVCFAKAKNIISGYPDVYFRPEQSIVFTEAAKVILGIRNTKIEKNEGPWYEFFIEKLSEEKEIPVSISELNQKISLVEAREMIDPSDRVCSWYGPYCKPFSYTKYEAGRLTKRISIDGLYYKDEDNNLYYISLDGEKLLKRNLSAAEMKSFATVPFLNQTCIVAEGTFQYAKDNQNVYAAENILEGADPNTFEIIACGGNNINDYGIYAKDKNRVYYDFSIIKDADPKTFQVVDMNFDISKDKNNVYRHGEIYIGNGFWDPASLDLSGYYIKDKNRIYFDPYWASCFEKSSGEVKDVDIGTFEILEGNRDYAKDKYHVFAGSEILQGADNKTIKFLDKEKCLLIDDKNVYLGKDAIPSADPTTFQVLKNGYAKDKNYVYQNGKILEGISPATFQP